MARAAAHRITGLGELFPHLRPAARNLAEIIEGGFDRLAVVGEVGAALVGDGIGLLVAIGT
jgi:hypothetical protein